MFYQVVQSLREEKHQTGVCACEGLLPRPSVTLTHTCIFCHTLSLTDTGLLLPNALHPSSLFDIITAFTVEQLICCSFLPLCDTYIVSHLMWNLEHCVHNILSLSFSFWQVCLPVGHRAGHFCLERSQRYPQRHHKGQVRHKSSSNTNFSAIWLANKTLKSNLAGDSSP